MTHDGRPLLMGRLPLGGREQGRKRWGKWGGQDEVRDGEELATRTCSPSHQDAAKAWNTALLFWSWKQCTCWRPEDLSSPHVSFPISSRYHWSVPTRVKPPVFCYLLCNFVWTIAFLFCSATKVKKKKKKLQELIMFFFRFLMGFNCLRVVSHSSIKLQLEWEQKMPLWPQNKSSWICFSLSVYLSCDSAEMGLWIWISSGSSVGIRGRATSLAAPVN